MKYIVNKKLKKYFIVILLSAVWLSGTAQTNCKIKKAKAFYSVSSPGTQMTDDNGNPIPVKPNITRFIFVEWTGSGAPQIETVFYNKQSMSVTVSVEEGNKAVLGSNYTNNPEFNITAKKCNSLWKLGLYPIDSNSEPELNCSDIVINIKGARGLCSFKITNETRLMTLPRY